MKTIALEVQVLIPETELERLFLEFLEKKKFKFEIPEKKFYNPIETADKLGVSVKTVYNISSSGRLKRTYIGKNNKPVYKKEDIEKYLDKE
jgi:hypothetical protein